MSFIIETFVKVLVFKKSLGVRVSLEGYTSLSGVHDIDIHNKDSK
jgi:hypothetical protein